MQRQECRLNVELSRSQLQMAFYWMDDILIVAGDCRHSLHGLQFNFSSWFSELYTRARAYLYVRRLFSGTIPSIDKHEWKLTIDVSIWSLMTTKRWINQCQQDACRKQIFTIEDSRWAVAIFGKYWKMCSRNCNLASKYLMEKRRKETLWRLKASKREEKRRKWERQTGEYIDKI